MLFKFVDDGYPDADDYSSNYEWVETATRESNPRTRTTQMQPQVVAVDCVVCRKKRCWWSFAPGRCLNLSRA